jgi:hypothetical protein
LSTSSRTEVTNGARHTHARHLQFDATPAARTTTSTMCFERSSSADSCGHTAPAMLGMRAQTQRATAVRSITEDGVRRSHGAVSSRNADESTRHAAVASLLHQRSSRPRHELARLSASKGRRLVAHGGRTSTYQKAHLVPWRCGSPSRRAFRARATHHAREQLSARALRKLQPGSLESEKRCRPIACVCKSLARLRASNSLLTCAAHEGTCRFNPRQSTSARARPEAAPHRCISCVCFDWVPTKRRRFPLTQRAMR